VLRRLRDLDAAGRRPADQPLVLETLERLAHGCRADTEAAGQSPFGGALAGGEISARDRLANRLIRLVSQGRACRQLAGNRLLRRQSWLLASSLGSIRYLL